MRGVGPSLGLEPTTTTSDGSRRVDRNLEMANKDVTESEQEQNQGCCQEDQEADEERTSRSGGPEGVNCNISQFEEKPHSSTYADLDSHQQSPSQFV